MVNVIVKFLLKIINDTMFLGYYLIVTLNVSLFMLLCMIVLVYFELKITKMTNKVLEFKLIYFLQLQQNFPHLDTHSLSFKI